MARNSPYGPSGRRHNAVFDQEAKAPRVLDDVNFGDRRPSNGVLQWLEAELEKHEAEAPSPSAAEPELRAWYAVRTYLTLSIARVKRELETPQKG